MVDADVVTAKLAELGDRISRLREHCPETSSALAASRDLMDLVSFNLMLAVQTCLDVASHVIADEGWPPASTLAESFQRLGEHQVIAAETSAALGRAAGLRNLVAHGYAAIEPELIHEAASSGLADLERFSSEVSGWLSRQLS